MTIAIYAASVALATLCIVLFFVAARRLLSRQEEIVTTMLRRYDERLADFAQTLNDALNRPQPAPALLPEEPQRAIPEHGVMRLLELAKERMSADAAVAVVSAPSKEPLLATVGLSQAEVAQVGRMGVPDYRGARALQVAFNGEAATPTRLDADPLRARRAAARRRGRSGDARRAHSCAGPPLQRAGHHDARGCRQRDSPRARGLARASRARSRSRARSADRALRSARVPCAPRPRDRPRAMDDASRWRCSCSTSTG